MDDVGKVGQQALVQRQFIQHVKQVVLGLLGEHLADVLVGASRVRDGVAQGVRAVRRVQLKRLADGLKAIPEPLELLPETPQMLPDQFGGDVRELQHAVVHLFGERLERVDALLHVLQVLMLVGNLKGEHEVSADHLVLLGSPLPELPLLVVGAHEEVLEALVLGQHGVAGHVVHP